MLVKARKAPQTTEQKLKASVDFLTERWRSPNEFIKTFYCTEPLAVQSLRYVEGREYAPDRILDSWLENVPSESRGELNRVITSKATEIMVEESTKAIRDPRLCLRTSNLTAAFITSDFSLDMISTVYKELLPCLYYLLMALMVARNDYEQKNKTEKAGKHTKAAKIIVVVISVLLFFRNRATNAFAVIVGVFLVSSGASRRVIDTFSHMGVSCGYQSVQRALISLSKDAKTCARDYIRKSDRLWGVVYDNINFTLRASSQRLDSTTQQINATTLAVFSFPAEFTRKSYAAALSILGRNKSKGERKKMTLESLYPTPEKHKMVVAAFEYAVGSILLAHVPGHVQGKSKNRKLRKYILRQKPKIRVLGHEKTKFFPLPALNEEESSVDGTIRVVKRIFLELLGLAEEAVVMELRFMVGDWLTIRNLRLMKMELKDEFKPFFRFDWVQEAAMPFHFQLNAMYCLFRTHLGTANQQNPSSLEHHRTLLRRAKLDIKKPEYNKAKELLLHSLSARLLDCLRITINGKSYDDLKEWNPSCPEFAKAVTQIVKQFTTTDAGSRARNLGDEVMAHSIFFMRDALFFWEFCDAVRDADVGRMWLVYDFWVFMMRGAGCHNYGNELLEMKAQFEYEFPEILRKVVERTWLVNRWGKKGQSIPTDLYLEHNNGFTKNMFAALGSCASFLYIEQKASACVEVLRGFSQQISEWFGGTDLNRGHNEVSVEADISALCIDIITQKLHEQHRNRPIFTTSQAKPKAGKGTSKSAVHDVLAEGMKMLNERNMFSQWMKRSLSTTGEDSEATLPTGLESSLPVEGEWDLEPAFLNPDGTLDIDTSYDEEFVAECSYSNIEADNTIDGDVDW